MKPLVRELVQLESGTHLHLLNDSIIPPSLDFPVSVQCESYFLADWKDRVYSLPKSIIKTFRVGGLTKISGFNLVVIWHIKGWSGGI